MRLSYRQLSLMEMLLYVGSMTVTHLAQSFNVSRKAIYDDLEAIRFWLQEEKTGTLSKDSLGRYSIKQPDRHMEQRMFEESHRFRNFEIKERHAFLLFHLVANPYTTLDELMKHLDVSRNTLQSDMQAVRKVASNANVTIRYYQQHYSFVGDEWTVRMFLINACSPYVQKLKHETLLPPSRSYGPPLSPQAWDCLDLSIFIQQKRMDLGYTIIELPYSKDGEDPEATYTALLKKGFSHQKQLDTSLLTGVTQLLETYTNLTGAKLLPHVDQKILAHLEPALARGKLGIVMHNPLQQEVEQKYAHTYRLLKMGLRQLAPFPLTDLFEQHEASYLTLLVLSHVEEKKAGVPIIVACYEGTSVSYSVKHQLIRLGIPDTDIQCLSFDNLPESMELLVTTTQIPPHLHAKKWLKVSPILTESDKAKLQHAIGDGHHVSQNSILEIVKRNVSPHSYKAILNEIQIQARLEEQRSLKGDQDIMLRDLITEETIQLLDRVEDWESAIDVVAAPLINTEKIDATYVAAIKENIHKNGAYIVLREEFALPHARPGEGVNELSMSLTILREPVGFASTETPVRVMVLLAAVDSSSHLNALAELVELISDEDSFAKLKAATTEQEVLTILQEKE
ncbi:PTS sugar transporter subunit IIA [Paenalkalicoccus suaedae]|uniref:Ascorbate-specific PTS system EIIA component n=1 Tax=Paenalkalicoccus suaedae TaxID=2592382 RepID=A0A859F9H7_9BACI|nr:PTS sugar transporter subunit IIA [Paenalkalicoccus suaedae]QKS69793.1 PTS sugar transporter subunit IIA [Paenalkalicoccus suaedae]